VALQSLSGEQLGLKSGFFLFLGVDLAQLPTWFPQYLRGSETVLFTVILFAVLAFDIGFRT
jgi:hypothetical protein